MFVLLSVCVNAFKHVAQNNVADFQAKSWNCLLLAALQIVICGLPSSADTKAMINCVHSRHLSRRVLIVLDPYKQDSFLRSRRQSLDSFVPVDGRATAYVCDNFTCSLPITGVAALDKLLSESAAAAADDFD